MALSRRHFMKTGARAAGIFATTSMLWSHPAYAQGGFSGDYKAIVVVTLNGGNDGNNTVVPLDPTQFAAYASLRKYLALPQSMLLPLNQAGGTPAYGLHPSLPTVASMYNSGKALVVANVGPIVRPSSKEEIKNHVNLYPGGQKVHPNALAAWERAQESDTGWGGRIADRLSSASGSLPLVLTTAQSFFTVGKSVQAVAVQGGSAFTPLPPSMTDAIANTAKLEQSSSRPLVAATAALRARAMASQQVLNRAASYDQIKTVFGQSQIHQSFKTIAQLIAGRSVIGASRQIFYTQQMGYDNHERQWTAQAEQLSDLDQGLAAFLTALDEIGMRDKVLICTHSDFCRGLQPNTSGGTDHAWGNHHFIVGEGIVGGRVVGQMPDMELNGAIDLDGNGCWIPTQSVTQMTAGISTWFGLSVSQVNEIFPDLQNFPAGAIRLS